MDKNIAAFLDKNAYTVSVAFTPAHTKSRKKYTYVCNIPDVQVGDWVVVDAPDFEGDNQLVMPEINVNVDSFMVIKGIPKMVLVTAVDKDVSIEPNSDIAHGWVISKLDMTAYRETIKRNSQITTLVADAYKVSMRRSFADQILGCMEADGKDKLLALLNK